MFFSLFFLNVRFPLQNLNLVPLSRIETGSWKERKGMIVRHSAAPQLFPNVTWILIRTQLADGLILGRCGSNLANISKSINISSTLAMCKNVWVCLAAEKWDPNKVKMTTPSQMWQSHMHTPSRSWIIQKALPPPKSQQLVWFVHANLGSDTLKLIFVSWEGRKCGNGRIGEAQGSMVRQEQLGDTEKKQLEEWGKQWFSDCS